MSDFRRNNTIKLKYINENYVIDDNLKWAWTVGSNMHITFVALSCDTNLEKILFSVLVVIVIKLFFDFSNCGDHKRNTTFRVLIGRIHDLE